MRRIKISYRQLGYDSKTGVTDAPFEYDDEIECERCGAIFYPSDHNHYLVNCPHCDLQWTKEKQQSKTWTIGTFHTEISVLVV